MTGEGPTSDLPRELSRLVRRRSSLFVLLWWWRYEALLVVATPLAVVELVLTIGGWESATVLVGGGAIVVLAPPVRRIVVARFWCIVTPHRVRAAILEAGGDTRAGRLPSILRTRRTPYGEQLLVAPRAGRDLAALRAALPSIVTACWARSATWEPHPRHRGLLVLDVVRRRG